MSLNAGRRRRPHKTRSDQTTPGTIPGWMGVRYDGVSDTCHTAVDVYLAVCCQSFVRSLRVPHAHIGNTSTPTHCDFGLMAQPHRSHDAAPSGEVHSPIAALFPDIFDRIFFYSNRAACATAALVCHAWNPVALDWVWRELSPSVLPLMKILAPMEKTSAGWVSHLSASIDKLLTLPTLDLRFRIIEGGLGTIRGFRSSHPRAERHGQRRVQSYE